MARGQLLLNPILTGQQPRHGGSTILFIDMSDPKDVYHGGVVPPAGGGELRVQG